MNLEATSSRSNEKDGLRSQVPLWEEQTFQETANLIVDGIYCFKPDGNFSFVNKAGIKLGGMTPEAFYSSYFIDFVHPAYHDLALQKFGDALKGEKDVFFDLKLINGDGREFIIGLHIKAIYHKRKVVGLLATARDITKRYYIEEALRVSEEKYRLFMEDANDAIIVSDADGYIKDVNRKAEELLGYSREEMYTMHYSQFHMEKERSETAFREIMETNIGGMHNTLMLRKDGKIVPVDITSKLIKYGGQKVIRGSYRDISDHLKIQDALAKMVKERTAELDVKNEELLKEVKEREQAEEHIRKLCHQFVKSQELERQRISYDLHDNVAQDLFSLKMDLDGMLINQQHASAEDNAKVLKLSELVQRVISSIREIACALSPQRLKYLGLLPTLSRYCEDFAKEYDVAVEFLPAGLDNVDMDFDIQITIYRVVQESLNNVRKHAGATAVSVKLVMSFPNIILRIKDNGKGFDVQKTLMTAIDKRRMGLQSMIERAAILKGNVRILSRPQQGTEVMMVIPLKEHQDAPKEDYFDN